jgi:hypothetical protein
MKTYLKLAFLAAGISVLSCKYEEPAKTGKESYSSVNEFFVQNAVPMQIYTINGSTGGSFTSPQGTLVSIPSEAFVNSSNVAVTANVTIQFKDLFKKSDILLSDMHTMDRWDRPLKSGGEFFIKAMSGNDPVYIKYGKGISVKIAASLTGGVDTANDQAAYILLPQDSGTTNNRWWPAYDNDLETQAEYYMYNFYQFSYPPETGTWLNCDNSTYFGKYSQTILTLRSKDASNLYNTQVFLVFTGVNTVIPLYYADTTCSYNYAPVGLQCTVVAFGVFNKTLYSSFVPVTITPNLTMDFKLSQTTTAEFKAKLELLN